MLHRISRSIPVQLLAQLFHLLQLLLEFRTLQHLQPALHGIALQFLHGSLKLLSRRFHLLLELRIVFQLHLPLHLGAL